MAVSKAVIAWKYAYGQCAFGYRLAEGKCHSSADSLYGFHLLYGGYAAATAPFAECGYRHGLSRTGSRQHLDECGHERMGRENQGLADGDGSDTSGLLAAAGRRGLFVVPDRWIYRHGRPAGATPDLRRSAGG